MLDYKNALAFLSGKHNADPFICSIRLESKLLRANFLLLQINNKGHAPVVTFRAFVQYFFPHTPS
jgi:hypothetical protein